MEKKYYGAIDGLRAIAAIGIIMMHIQANNVYGISGFLYNKVIPSFTNFVFLFMAISAFGMCCGYCEKILKSQVSISYFYRKRFKKILPYFGVLVLLDIIISPSFPAFCEGFADLTLMFGLLPDPGNISVIGVGWFLGLVFVFYLCFPFFCAMLENRKRAWIGFGISLVYHFVGSAYFGINRCNILYSACFFFAGGLIYLYKEEISRLNKWGMLGVMCGSILLYYIWGENSVTCLMASASLLVYGTLAERGILENRVTRFLGNISMELYLSHMVVFRIIEKLGMNRVVGNGWIQYVITVAIVLAGTIVFALIVRKILKELEGRIDKIASLKGCRT